MRKDGKFLERTIAGIEKAIANDESYQIEPRKRLRDRTTGRLREHDIVLTIQQKHHEVVLAIECRDRSRPVGVPQVESFNAKCLDTGVHQGVIVSPSGFCKTARKKAEHLGIRCLDFSEVDSFNWMATPGLQTIQKRILNHGWVFFPEKDGVVSRENMDVLDEKGNPLDPKILIQNTSRILDKVVRFEGKEQFEVEPSEKEVLKLRVETPGLKLRNSETGEPIPILFAVVEIIYAIDIKFTPFKLARYEDKRTGEHISDVAIAPLKWGNKSVSLMMVYKEDEGGSLILVNN